MAHKSSYERHKCGGRRLRHLRYNYFTKIETSPYFTKVEFTSPTIRDVRMNADRFVIRMELDGIKKRSQRSKWGKTVNFYLWLIPFLVILLGFAFYDYVYMAIQAEKQTLDELKESKQKTLEKYISALDQKGALENRINALKDSRKSRETTTVEGQTPSVAAANLQNMVKGIITGKGGTISSEGRKNPRT